MNKSISIRTLAAAALSLTVGSAAIAADKLPAKVNLTCSFAAAQASQKIKPGAKSVSDGVVRISADPMKFAICNACKAENSAAKWRVTPTQYRLSSPSGTEIIISRADGSATIRLTSNEDELYFSAQVESRGQCSVAARPTKP